MHSSDLLLEDWGAGAQLGAAKSTMCLIEAPGSGPTGLDHSLLVWIRASLIPALPGSQITCREAPAPLQGLGSAQRVVAVAGWVPSPCLLFVAHTAPACLDRAHTIPAGACGFPLTHQPSQQLPGSIRAHQRPSPDSWGAAKPTHSPPPPSTTSPQWSSQKLR